MQRDHQWTRSFAIVAAALTLFLASCNASQTTVPSAMPSGSGAPSASASAPASIAPSSLTFSNLPDLVAEVEPSVVSVLRADGGQGSGVIWSSDGKIVTNNHVVAGATQFQVAFADGQRVNATVIATDPRTDLAVMQADRQNLPPATFSTSLPEVGALALAMGNPIGFENSVTQGIISGLHRSIPGSAQQSAALVDLIQTDAAISPGNSGGALVGGDGKVMGINVAYIPPNSQQGAVAIGFAIPAPTVTDAVQQLLDTGTVQHAYIGIRPATLTPQLAQRLGTQADHGVAVITVEQGGPADAAGLQPGDIITALDGTELNTVEDLLAALREHSPGDQIPLTIMRGGKQQQVQVTLGDLPSTGPSGG